MNGRIMVVALGVTGCAFPALPPLDEDAPPADASDDGQVAQDATDAAHDAPSCVDTTCSDGVLQVCVGNEVQSVETCRLGCFSNARCNYVDPSNGLGTQLEGSAGLSAIAIPAASTIDTDTGVVRSSGGQVIAVATETIAQSGGPTLRVLMAKSFVLESIQIRGSLPVAFVAMDDVVVQGIIDASADVGVAGPGAVDCAGNGRGGHPAQGSWTTARAGHLSEQYAWSSGGGGGGGFGTIGAQGGAGGSGGTLQGGAGGVTSGTSTLIPLRGGCGGGGVNSGNVDVGNGGRAGGAVQIVSGKGEIVLRGVSPDLGGVHVGGSGGRGCGNVGGNNNPPAGAGCGPGGGGSGGGILLEAASVRFETGAVLLAAGGGGGGSGGCGTLHGQDASSSGALASGGSCPAEAWGTPAPGGAGAGTAASQVGATASYWLGGSGGGGSGRLRINTGDGTYVGGSNLVSRGVLSTGSVTTR